MLTYTLVLFVSLLSYVVSLESIRITSKERVLLWEKPMYRQHWALVSKPCFHKSLLQLNAPVARHEMYGVFISFITAVFGIICAILMFWESDIRCQQVYLHSSSGSLHYGRNETGVLRMVSEQTVGIRGTLEVIVTVYIKLGLGLVFFWYKFSTTRENQLSSSSKPLQFFQAIIQSCLGVLARIPLVKRNVFSYRREHKRTARELGKLFDLEEFDPRVRFSSLWNGSLEFSSKQLPPVSRRQELVERSAAFLAGDKFGRLHYPQVLAFLANQDHVQAVDAFRDKNDALSVRQVLLLSRLFSIKGALVPVRSNEGLTREDFTILDVDERMDDKFLAEHPRSVALLASADDTDNVTDAPPQNAILRWNSTTIFHPDSSSLCHLYTA